MLVSEIVTFWLKSEVLGEFPQKYFKTTEKLSLAVCDSIWGGKTFLLILIPIYWFDQKKLFTQTQIFLRICPLSNMVRKTNFLSISVLVSEIVNFLTKKRSSPWISPKILQNNRKVWLSCMWLNLLRKTVFVNIFPYYWFDQKQLFKQIQICHFSNMVRKTNFPNISVLDSEIVNFWTKERSSLLISSKML